MFKNIGKKIKVLTIVFFIIGCVFAGIAMIVCWIAGGMMLGSRYTQFAGIMLILAGFLVGGLGFLMSWTGSFIMYGYGELIDSSQKTANNTDKLLSVLASKDMNNNSYYNDTTAANYQQPADMDSYSAAPAQNGRWRCSNCGAENLSDAMFCNSCGQHK